VQKYDMTHDEIMTYHYSPVKSAFIAIIITVTGKWNNGNRGVDIKQEIFTGS
jgi:hypothetical protein